MSFFLSRKEEVNAAQERQRKREKIFSHTCLEDKTTLLLLLLGIHSLVFFYPLPAAVKNLGRRRECGLAVEIVVAVDIV